MKRVFYISLIGAIIILVDQFTKGVVQDSFYLGESKTIIEGLFNLTYVKNSIILFVLKTHEYE